MTRPRVAWLMIVGGAAGVVVFAPLGLFPEGIGWFITWMVFTIIAGLVFGAGVVALVGRGGFWMISLAFAVGTIAPAMISQELHNAVMTTFGAVEKCHVMATEEYHWEKGARSGHGYDYVIACPSGTVEESETYSHRLESDEVDVYQLPPLRPELARNVNYEPWNLWGCVIAMVALVGVGVVFRRR
ncbi:hypothetical protein FKR81_36460 [Lentzea tibetensis]|uniref:Uncharacterized protein n=1 Tax=Lentzea tibetensis TaxID=2591470 RepID=A0A563EI09_9PSEU|nr:hypothetical protein [Lentzea tibetensis]TWP46235.1 hypothetical protein FKR81_36460 [Lentzea tibetensis]